MPGGNMRLESVATSDRRKTAGLDLIEQQEHVLQVIDPCGRTGPKHGNSLLNCCTTINYSLFHQWFTNDSLQNHLTRPLRIRCRGQGGCLGQVQHQNIRWSKLCIDSVSPIFLHFSLSFCLALRADSQAFNASLSWVAWSREEFTMTAVTSTLPAFHVRS